MTKVNADERKDENEKLTDAVAYAASTAYLGGYETVRYEPTV